MNANPIFNSILLVDDYKPSTNLSVGIKTFFMFSLMILSGIGSCYVSASLEIIIALASIIIICSVIPLALNNQKYAIIYTIILSISLGFAFGSLARYIESLVPNVPFSIMIASCISFAVSLFFFTFSFFVNKVAYKKLIFAIIAGIIILQFCIFIYSYNATPESLKFTYGKGIWLLVVDSLLLIIITFFYLFNFEYAQKCINFKYAKKTEWMIVLGIIFSTVAIFYQVFLLLKMIMSYIFDK